MPADITVDVLCAGSGAGGCAAALVAAELGLEPLLVEKGDLLGGATAYSYGGLWAGKTHVAARAGFEDSLDQAAAYMRFVASGFELPENLAAYIEWAPRVLEAYEAMGLRFQVIPVPDHHYPHAPGSAPGGRTLEAEPVDEAELGQWQGQLVASPYLPRGVAWTDMVAWGGIGNTRNWPAHELADPGRKRRYAAGQALVAQLLRGLEQRHVRVLRRARVERLTSEGGAVTGAVVSVDGGEQLIRARRGVVLATGGYESNPTLARRLEGLPGFASMFPRTIEGDGLIAGSELGAALYRVPVNLILMLGYMVPEAAAGEVFRAAAITEMAYPHTIVVNRGGRRFADESQFQNMAPVVHQFDDRTHQYRNLPCFLIFDSQFAATYSFAGAPDGTAIPEWVAREHSWGALADRLGLDAAQLESTVSGFNQAAARGDDPEFGRGSSRWANASAGDMSHQPNPNLGPLDTPPYYGLELRPTCQSSAGLLTNELGQVMHLRGQPIAGLYGCGNVTAPTHFGSGYQAGFTLMGSLTFAYRAVQHAAGARPHAER